MISGSQIRAARALLRWSGKQLASASGVSWPTIQRMEAAFGLPSGLAKNIMAIKETLEAAGIEFIDANGGGAGVRFKEPQ